MNISPTHDRVLVKPLDSDTVTKSGLIIPDAAKEKPQQAIVIAVGKGRTLENGTVIPMTVKKDDTVLFGKYSGQQVKLDNVDYIILKEDDILAIVE